MPSVTTPRLTRTSRSKAANTIGSYRGGVADLPFGIDFGGTGIKGAPVDLEKGEFAAERERIKTPSPSTPEAVAEVFVELLAHFPGLPRARSASPSRAWCATASSTRPRTSTRPGSAPMPTGCSPRPPAATCTWSTTRTPPASPRRGTAPRRASSGLVILTTLGTGIGSALVYDGVLVPNSELGHLEIDGHDAESRAANSARERDDLSMEHWAKRLTKYYRTLEMLFSPDLFVVGGGISKQSDEFLPLIEIDTEIVPATLLNKAGVVGAALYAAEEHAG